MCLRGEQEDRPDDKEGTWEGEKDRRAPSRSVLPLLWTGCGTVSEQLMTNLGKTFSNINLEAGRGMVLLVSVILVFQEAKEGRSQVQGQPRQCTE